MFYVPFNQADPLFFSWKERQWKGTKSPGFAAVLRGPPSLPVEGLCGQKLWPAMAWPRTGASAALALVSWSVPQKECCCLPASVRSCRARWGSRCFRSLAEKYSIMGRDFTPIHICGNSICHLKITFFFHLSFIIHMCIQGLGHFSPLPPPPPLPPTPPPPSPPHPLNIQQKLFCPCF
jgi:hypothetical protein